MKRMLWLSVPLFVLTLLACAPRRAVVPTATPTQSLLATATATPFATPSPTPIVIPEGATRVNIYCQLDCEKIVSTGDWVAVYWFWAAKTPELVQSFLDTATYEVDIDGLPLEDPERFMGPAGPYADGDYDGDGEDDFSALWIYGLGPLAPGTHTITLRVDFSTTITDGFDVNPPAGPDEYGPGQQEFFVRIIAS